MLPALVRLAHCLEIGEEDAKAYCHRRERYCVLDGSPRHGYPIHVSSSVEVFHLRYEYCRVIECSIRKQSSILFDIPSVDVSLVSSSITTAGQYRQYPVECYAEKSTALSIPPRPPHNIPSLDPCLHAYPSKHNSDSQPLAK